MKISAEYIIVINQEDAHKLVILMKLCTNNDALSKTLETHLKVFAATLGETLEGMGA
jgi:phosphoribosyl-AMP cyclohydrolase